jgi:hypothetical protein
MAEQPALAKMTVLLLQEAVPGVLSDDDGGGKQELAPADLPEDVMVFADLAIRWVNKDKIELRALRRQTFQTGQDLAGHDVEPVMDFECREVAANQLGGAPMVLDEHYFPSAAAEGFETHGAAARVGIEKGRAFQLWPQDVEKGLAKLVRGRPQVTTFQGLQAKPTVCAGNNAHGSEPRSAG